MSERASKLRVLQWLHAGCIAAFAASAAYQLYAPLDYSSLVGLPKPSLVFFVNATSGAYERVAQLGALPDAYFYAGSTASFSPTGVSAAFLLLALLDHVYQLLWLPPAVALEGRPNGARWLEYALSASDMHVQIAVAVGADDLVKLGLLCALTAALMATGYELEALGWRLRAVADAAAGGGRALELGALSKLLPAAPQLAERDAAALRSLEAWLREALAKQLLWGWLCFAAIWGVLLLQYALSVSSDTPGFVHAIVGVLFCLDASFGLAALWALTLPREQLYKREAAYAVLSLSAKMSLAWIQWGGFKARG